MLLKTVVTGEFITCIEGTHSKRKGLKQLSGAVLEREKELCPKKSLTYSGTSDCPVLHLRVERSNVV